MPFFIEPKQEREDGWIWLWGALILQPFVVCAWGGVSAYHGMTRSGSVIMAVSLGFALGACIAVIRRYRHAAGAWVWLVIWGAPLVLRAKDVIDRWIG